MIRKATALLILLLAAGCAQHCAAGEARALIVCGDPGHEGDSSGRFADWTTRWRKLLAETYGFKAENVRVLRSPARNAEGKATETVPEAETATHDNVIAAMDKLAKETQESDQAVLVIIGHGYGSQGIGKICLHGKDIGDVDAGKAFKGLKGRLICINTAPASGPWCKSLASPKNIVITATVSDSMASMTYYSEFLLKALAPGNVSLLDAFNKSSLEMIHWYQNQFMDAATKKNAKQSELVMTVNGKDNLELWKKLYPSKQVEAGTAEPVETSNNFEDKKSWQARRVLSELPGLEDNGDGEPASVFSDQELEEAGRATAPLPAKDHDGVKGDGHLAKTVVLGKP
ncbi:MAG: caspase family protein [Planctomycetes bacterium]|nr:caspase family protein [Planctomycetota bacterium]